MLATEKSNSFFLFFSRSFGSFNHFVFFGAVVVVVGFVVDAFGDAFFVAFFGLNLVASSSFSAPLSDAALINRGCFFFFVRKSRFLAGSGVL
jgi:hypothetical protein